LEGILAISLKSLALAFPPEIRTPKIKKIKIISATNNLP